MILITAHDIISLYDIVSIEDEEDTECYGRGYADCQDTWYIFQYEYSPLPDNWRI